MHQEMEYVGHSPEATKGESNQLILCTTGALRRMLP